MIFLRKPALMLSVALIVAGCADNATEPAPEETFDPAEVAGVYAIHEVDGHPVGWYHDLAAVDCQAAFLDGQLDIGENGQYILDLDYDFRCLGTDPFDGSGRFYAQGTIKYKEGEVFVLSGLGPNFVDPARVWDNWTFELRPNGDYVELRFAEFYRDYWADPVITLGPRQQ